MKFFKISYILIALGIFAFANVANADIHPDAKKEIKKRQFHQMPSRNVTNLFDVQRNTVSNIEFVTSNYGIFGYDVPNGIGTGYWPRNSRNQYIFGGGTWFAAQKPRADENGDLILEVRDTVINGVQIQDTLRDSEGNPIPRLFNFVVVSYNPNNARSWFVPGRVRDRDGNLTLEADFNEIHKYRTYFSTDFNSQTGEEIDPAERDWPNWPIWDTVINETVKEDRYFGFYIEQEERRNTETFSKGPAFISGEDIFATFKDTDLRYYDNGFGFRKRQGYPLYIQIEHMIYSWGFGQYRDFIFLKWDFINLSNDTLLNCWHAPIMDVDVARQPFGALGAQNDRVQWYECDPDLNMAVQWSDPQNGEEGFGFGYLGFDYLESPSIIEYHIYPEYECVQEVNGVPVDTICVESIKVRPSNKSEENWVSWNRNVSSEILNPGLELVLGNDPNGTEDRLYFDRYLNRDGDTLFVNDDTYDATNFLRKSQRWYPVPEQLGLVTFRNWSIQDDKLEDNDRYEFMAAAVRDGDTGPGDKRYMMATGPYNMFPADTARVVVGILLARTALGGEASGECEDMTVLDAVDRFAQTVYDNSFQAPQPPERSIITSWKPLNNGMIIQWDSTAEISRDPYEKGLDFLGYKIYRARRPELDTFSASEAAPTQAFPNGTGPLGWKQIADFDLPQAWLKTNRTASTAQGNPNFLPMDSLLVVGPYFDPEKDNGNGGIDSMAIRVMRIPTGGIVAPPQYVEQNTGDYRPGLWTIDPYNQPWGPFFDELAGPNAFNNINRPLYPDDNSFNYLMDSVLVGVAYLNRSILNYNPLFYRKRTIPADSIYLTNLLNSTEDTDGNEIWIRETKEVVDTAGNVELITTQTIDTVYYYNTLHFVQGVGYTVDVSIPRPINQIMNDFEHVNETRDIMMQYITENKVRVEFPKREVESYLPQINAEGEAVRVDTISIFQEFEEWTEVQQEVITPYMNEITNGRTLIDVGDDNRDGFINYSEDPASPSMEKMLNNVAYYYKIIAYDEGDIEQPTPIKENDGTIGLPNVVKTFPAAPSSGLRSEIEIISVDSNKVGGLFNFNFFAIDQERLTQQFAGDTLELTFDPFWFNFPWIPPTSVTQEAINITYFARLLTLENISTGDTLYNGFTQLEPVPCQTTGTEQLSNNAVSYLLAEPDSLIIDSTSFQYVPELDSSFYTRVITFHTDTSHEIRSRTGNFTTGDFGIERWCYANGFADNAYGILGFEFDYTVHQFGGLFRPDSIEKVGSATSAYTPIVKLSHNRAGNSGKVLRPQVVDGTPSSIGPVPDQNGNIAGFTDYYEPRTVGFNNGPGEYILEFTPGGTEEVTFSYGGDASAGENTEQARFVLNYLNVRVIDNTTFNRATEFEGGDSVEVSYQDELDLMTFGYSRGRNYGGFSIPERPYPHPSNIVDQGGDPIDFIGKFNIWSYGWINSRLDRFGVRQKDEAVARPVNDNFLNGSDASYTGLEGRYYLSATSVDDPSVVIDFTHILNIGGAQYALDYAAVGDLYELDEQFNWDSEDVWEDNGWDDVDRLQLGQLRDFAAGDQVYIRNFGGVLGLPAPGAKVRAVVSGKQDQASYTDDDLRNVNIVPNPYYITHQEQKSPYDAQIYFTELPDNCKIEIYTLGGDLVKTIDHNNGSGNLGREGLDVWDLLTKNGLRVQSQPLVAVITTPDGAQVVKNFAVVVGSYRVLPD